jgi:hypothetical protein
MSIQTVEIRAYSGPDLVTLQGTGRPAIVRLNVGPAGPEGPQGEPGEPGEPGPNSVTSETTSDGTADLSVATITGDGSGLTGLKVTRVFANQEAVDAAVPDFVGQIGLNLFSGGLLQSIGTNVGDWNSNFAFGDINATRVFSTGNITAATLEVIAFGQLVLNSTSPGGVVRVSGQPATFTRDVSFPDASGTIALFDENGNFTVEGTLTADHIHGNLAGSVYAHVRAGETLAKGDPVYISGSHGSGEMLIPIVSKADASNAAKMPAVGIMDAALANNANGHMVITGTITELNTNAYAVNSVLYVASGGGFTATPPAANSQAVAIVERSNPNNGAVIVKVNGLASSGGNGASDANKLVRFTSTGGISQTGGTMTDTTYAGSAAFTSTTRPTSAGTGTPAATSLITATDRRTEEVSDLANVYYRQIMGHELGVWATVGASPSSVIDGNNRAGCRFIGTTGLSSASAQGGGIKYPDGGITGGSFFSLTLSFDFRFLFRNSLSATIFDVAHFVSLRNNTNFWSAQSIGLYHVPQPAATWAATTAYTVGNRINVSGIVYVCSTAGTSGGSQPTFNATINGTTNDNTAVWRTLGPHTSDKWALAFVDASGNITLTDTGVAWVSGTSNTTALRIRSNGSSVFASVNGSAEVSVSRGSLLAATPYIMCRGDAASTRIAGLIWTVETSNI